MKTLKTLEQAVGLEGLDGHVWHPLRGITLQHEVTHIKRGAGAGEFMLYVGGIGHLYAQRTTEVLVDAEHPCREPAL